MRYINKAAIHAEAVKIGRASRNGMKRTANRLAASDVDKAVGSILTSLKAEAWSMEDAVIIEACARRLWLDWLTTEINLQK